MAQQQIVSYIENQDVFRTKCLLHCDLSKNRGTVMIGGDRSSWTLSGALDYLKVCAEAIRGASRQQSKRRAAAKLLVYCTELDVLRPLISDKIGIVGEIGDKVKYCKHYRNYIATETILFANANVILNNTPQKVHEMIGGESVDQSVAALLDSMCDDWTRIRWSLAHHTQGRFYKCIGRELWADMAQRESAYYYSMQAYDDMLTGNKSGALARFDGDNCRYQRQVLTGIISIDKRSAYPSVMVNDSCFPIRQIEQVKHDRLAMLRDCIAQRRWCKLVIDRQCKGLDLWYDDDANAHGLDIYDILLCFQMGHGADLLSSLDLHEWRLYISTVQCWADSIEEADAVYYPPDGYLSTDLRMEITDRYEQKEMLCRGSPERHMAKTQIDMICGKGLQRIKAESLRALNRSLRGRGDRYIRPQHSMHTIAAVRLELFQLVKRITDACGSKAVIAFDTDGLKAKDSKTVRSIIQQHNSDIMERNIRAGFYSSIGTWCIEYTAKRFLQIGTKQYIYVDADTGELVTKSAGIPKIDLMHAIKGLHMAPCEAIDYIASHKIPVDRRAGYIYDPESQSFIEQRETVMF